MILTTEVWIPLGAAETKHPFQKLALMDLVMEWKNEWSGMRFVSGYDVQRARNLKFNSHEVEWQNIEVLATFKPNRI